MLVKSASEGFRRPLRILAAAATFVLPGCAVTTVQYADRQLEPYLKALTRQTESPIARTVTWKYHYTLEPGRNQQVWFIADGKLLRSPKEIAGVQIYAAQPTTSGVTTGAVYTQRAREATRRGDHQTAQVYHGLSSTAVQTQIASERVAAGMALGSAIQGLGTALLDATIISHGSGAAQYVSTPERGVIGDSAPEGTVLELFFRGVRRNGEDAKPGNLSMRWETVATLKDASGRIWRSDAFFTNYFHHSFSSDTTKITAAFSDPRYMLMVTNTLMPAHNRDFVPEEAEMKKIWGKGGAAEFGITAMQAIGDLYEQIAMAKGRRPR